MRKSNIFLFGMIIGAWLNIWGAAIGWALRIELAPFILPYLVLAPILFANIAWKGK